MIYVLIREKKNTWTIPPTASIFFLLHFIFPSRAENSLKKQNKKQNTVFEVSVSTKKGGEVEESENSTNSLAEYFIEIFTSSIHSTQRSAF